jgi:hypothetical protein
MIAGDEVIAGALSCGAPSVTIPVTAKKQPRHMFSFFLTDMESSATSVPKVGENNSKSFGGGREYVEYIAQPFVAPIPAAMHHMHAPGKSLSSIGMPSVM